MDAERATSPRSNASWSGRSSRSARSNNTAKSPSVWAEPTWVRDTTREPTFSTTWTVTAPDAERPRATNLLTPSPYRSRTTIS